MEKTAVIRLSFFLGIFLVMACWEMFSPKRKKTTSKPIRWLWNLGLAVLNPLIVRLLFPVLAVTVAVKARPRDGHIKMTIGLKQFRNTAEVTLPRLLIMPFAGKQGKYALGRRGT